jgi:hypothetical protein
MDFDNHIAVVILQSMKTAGNVPDDLFPKAGHTTERIHLSSGELYVRDLAATLDPVIAEMQSMSLPRDDNW